MYFYMHISLTQLHFYKRKICQKYFNSFYIIRKVCSKMLTIFFYSYGFSSFFSHIQIKRLPLKIYKTYRKVIFFCKTLSQVGMICFFTLNIFTVIHFSFVFTFRYLTKFLFLNKLKCLFCKFCYKKNDSDVVLTKLSFTLHYS